MPWRTSESATSTCREHHAFGQRGGALQRRRTPSAARAPPEGRPRVDRHQRRLRHVVVRSVHGAARRRVGEVVHDAGGAGRRPRHHHHRGPGGHGRGWRRRCESATSGAAGVPRAARPAVRLLHSGHGDGGGVAAGGEPPSDRGRRPLGPGGQPLPLHRLPQHRPLGAGRRRRAARGGAGMTATEVGAETQEAKVGRGMGARLPRKEDARLLTGEARFVDDLDVPGALWMGMVRSPYAHARIGNVDASAALAIPGVRQVFTGADLRDDWAAAMPCAWPVTEDMKAADHWPVAVDKACYVGDIVAVVVAEDRYAAVDGVDAVAVDYDPLEAVVDLEDAASDRVVIHEGPGTNRSYTWTLAPEPEAVERAFAEAAHVVRERYVQQRLIPMAIEPRGVAVVPGVYGGDLTVYSATQIPHILRVMIAATCGVPEAKVRVIAPSVGGGFGSKLNVYAEELIAVVVARRLGVPTRWTEGRSENAVATIQGRGQIQDMELAADAEGKVTAVRVKLVADMGAYMQLVTPGIPLLGAFLYHGVYDVPAYHFECTGVFTTKTPTDAYRGAGRPEATYAIERAMDALARAVGVDSVEIRRRNYIPPDKFPYDSSAGLTYDSGNYEPTLDRALELIGYEERRAEQQRRRDAGDTRHLGIGLATY